MTTPIHSWNLTPQEAIAIQKKLAPLVLCRAPKTHLRFIAGLDLAFSPDKTQCIAGVVLWDSEQKQMMEQHTATYPATFPYIPGLLSFREIPALLTVFKKLTRQPDAVMCDGHGIAHPRRFGIAAHMGVLLDLPTVGCAKSRLVGNYIEPAEQIGAKSALTHHHDIIGTVLRTKNRVKPVFVSIGHRMDLATAEQLVLNCTTRYRLPEPTRLADRLVARSKKIMTLNITS